MSNKLSIAAVLGLATLPILPREAALGVGRDAHRSLPAPIELVHAKPVPVLEDPSPTPAFQLAARRSRVKPEPPAAADPEASAPRDRDATTRNRDAKSGEAPSSKTSSISRPEADSIPLPPSRDATSSSDAQAEPPKPDVWTDTLVIGALRECVRLLGPIVAEVEIAEPVKHEQCGAPAPVMLRSIGSGADKVAINPPAMVNCAMVAHLHTWVEKTLQPAAREALGSPVARLRNASGYACRTRVGSHFHADRISEHALANAMDIAGFITADGRAIEVSRHWGPTTRDQQEARKVAATPPAADEGVAKDTLSRDRKTSAIAHAAAAQQARHKKPVQTAELEKVAHATSDISSDPNAVPATAAVVGPDIRDSIEAKFLRRLHRGACGVFGTVLGPEANEAHRDHFHFDLAYRARNAYCQ